MSLFACLVIRLLVSHWQCVGASEDSSPKETLLDIANGQLSVDLAALSIAYDTDFVTKLFPGLYATQGSKEILEIRNSADYKLTSVKQSSAHNLAAYLCFLEPDTSGCENFNSLGCSGTGNNCDVPTYVNQELASLCSATSDADPRRKFVDSTCFIVSLRESSDGTSRDALAPWNHEVQKWMDDHNCTSLMYHLRYRCYSNLIKWDQVHARAEYVDLDSLFDSVFGIKALASFNDGRRFECSSLNLNDRFTLIHTARINVEAAVLGFVEAAASLARYGLAAADVTYRQKGPATFASTSLVQHKLRTTLLLNFLFDGTVEPLKQLCCSVDACEDYHPMDTLVDKVVAVDTFYPGGLSSLTAQSDMFDGGIAQANSAGHSIKAIDSYVYNVLRESPNRIAYQASVGDELTDIEGF